MLRSSDPYPGSPLVEQDPAPDAGVAVLVPRELIVEPIAGVSSAIWRVPAAAVHTGEPLFPDDLSGWGGRS